MKELLENGNKRVVYEKQKFVLHDRTTNKLNCLAGGDQSLQTQSDNRCEYPHWK